MLPEVPAPHQEADSPTCVLCDTGEEDDVEHTLVRCPHFAEVRSRRGEGGKEVAQLVAEMLESEERWAQVSALVKEVPTEKESQERVRRAR